ncbi:unnamed protein product [Pleuronectes platessa]|uniref:G-protein coupled receptors family 1 profile domain-containing protein n=1 Tax=Pleuronectes platessa TaxID=8262 RepID=A0A9N7UMT8_PLEPL|nr:unnamed protein product [Pleuronectes platessa]
MEKENEKVLASGPKGNETAAGENSNYGTELQKGGGRDELEEREETTSRSVSAGQASLLQTSEMESPGYEDDDNYTFCVMDDYNTLGAHLSILYYFMFLFSLCGTVLVLVIIYRFEKLTTVTNILLLNLVLSSLIFMSSLPFLGVYMQLDDWIFGKAMCKIVCSVYYLGFSSSVLFLTLLTFDRHLAVVYSLEAPRVRKPRLRGHLLRRGVADQQPGVHQADGVPRPLSRQYD